MWKLKTIKLIKIVHSNLNIKNMTRKMLNSVKKYHTILFFQAFWRQSAYAGSVPAMRNNYILK